MAEDNISAFSLQSTRPLGSPNAVGDFFKELNAVLRDHAGESRGSRQMSSVDALKMIVKTSQTIF